MTGTSILPFDPLSEIHLLTAVGNDYRTSRAIWVASLVVLLYDLALTFNQEISYLRKCRYGWNTAIYVITRYLPITNLIFSNIALAVARPPESFCLFFFNWVCYAGAPVHVTVDIILVQRLYAMYNRNRILLRVLSVLVVIQVVSETIMMGQITAKMRPVSLPSLFPGCIPDNPTSHTWAYWIPILVLQSILFVLAIVKAFEVARKESHTPRILAVLLRDSVLYFGSVLAIILSNLVIWAAARPSLVAVALGPAIAAHSLSGCRMLLNIHQSIQPTYAGHASIFATTFVKAEPAIELKHLRSRLQGTSALTSSTASENGAEEQRV